MTLRQFPPIVTHTSELFCVALYISHGCNSFHILQFTCLWPWQTCMWTALYLPQSKCTKFHKEEIPSISRNVLEFFCVPLYKEFLSDLCTKFQVASIYDKNIQWKIRRFWCNFCNRHTHIHTDQPLKMWCFRIQRTSKRVNPSKYPFQKFDKNTIFSLPYMCKRNSNK